MSTRSPRDESGFWYFSGFGLGLPIVKVVAEAHGGTVRARSASGKGSVFEILIPAISARLTSTPIHTASSPCGLTLTGDVQDRGVTGNTLAKAVANPPSRVNQAPRTTAPRRPTA